MKGQDVLIINGKKQYSCPFARFRGKGFDIRMSCKFNEKRTCRYGLTEIRVPKSCPLRKKGVIETLTVTLRGEEK